MSVSTSKYLARVSKASRAVNPILTSVSSIANVPLKTELTLLPAKPLGVEGPYIGIIKNGPEPTPQVPKVCPKSSSCLSRPNLDPTSIKPPSHIGDLIINREKSFIAIKGLPCNNWLAVLSSSFKFLKKLVIPTSMKSGVMDV